MTNNGGYKRTVYSIPGAIIGGVVGATSGSVGSVYLIDFIQNSIKSAGDIAVILLPVGLALGGGLGAYIGGRIFGQREYKD